MSESQSTPSVAISKKLWFGRCLVVLQRCEFRCHFCGDKAGSVDHLVRLFPDGVDDPENLVAVCHVCQLIARRRTFTDSHDKEAFIRARRHQAGRTEAALKARHVAICPCGDLFQPGVDDASNVLCGPCYEKSSLKPWER